MPFDGEYRKCYQQDFCRDADEQEKVRIKGRADAVQCCGNSNQQCKSQKKEVLAGEFLCRILRFL